MSTSRKTFIAGIASASLFAASLGTIWKGLPDGSAEWIASPVAGLRAGRPDWVTSSADQPDEEPAPRGTAPRLASLRQETRAPRDRVSDREKAGEGEIEDQEAAEVEEMLRRPRSDLDRAREAGGEGTPLSDLDLGSLLPPGSGSSASGAVEGPSDADLNQAAAALQALEEKDEILRAAFEDSDPRRRTAAALVAARLESGELAGPLFELALDDDDGEVRRAAAGALASMNVPAAADALLGLLSSADVDPAARLSAWSGLARLGREEAWGAFEGLLASAGGEVTREMVVEAALVNDDERLREPLERALDGLELAEPVRVKLLSRLNEGLP